MTDAAVPTVPDVAPRAPWLPLLAVVALGAAAAWTLASPAPGAPGARRIAAPENLLGAFDALVLVLLVRPGRRDVAETAALLVAAAPFHAALASSADACPGHLAATLASALAWGTAALVRTSAPARAAWMHAALVACVTFAVPLAAYGLAEFVRLPVDAAFLASPLTGPVLLARRAATASAGDAIPAFVAAGLVVTLSAIAGRRAGRAA